MKKIIELFIEDEINGIKPTIQKELGDLVILAGSNGSGKTRLLKLIMNALKGTQSTNESNVFKLLVDVDGNKLDNKSICSSIVPINFSHYDAKMQSPLAFPPYVIAKAKDILLNCDYDETALNSLLFLQDLANGYSSVFEDGTKFNSFVEFADHNFGLKVSKDEKGVKVSGIDVENANLSPGQLYLLRIAVSCFQNKENDSLIFFLDEPELHLHPKALIAVVNNLRKKFTLSQFWIATHSLALISYFMVMNESTTIFHLIDGTINKFRSNSEALLNGLIGAEENIFAIRQLLSLPDEFACLKFAVECFMPPEVLTARGNDPETDLVRQDIKSAKVIVDFGAGKGRLLEELGDNISEIGAFEYYAYDVNEHDANICKEVMNFHGFKESFYFNDISKLKQKLNSKADYVLLINVLHEINPIYWNEVFSDISALLKEKGHLLIVERDELTFGESPYNEGFLVLTNDAASELFGTKFKFSVHSERKHIVKYDIDKEALNSISMERVYKSIDAIKNNAINKIMTLRSEISNERSFKKGISMAFWLNQYATANLVISNYNQDK